MSKNMLSILCLLLSVTLQAESEYVVRHVQMSDAASLTDLYRLVAASTNNTALLPEDITLELTLQLLDVVVLDGLGIVVVRDEQLVGYMLKQRYKYTTSRHVLYGGSIGIHPDYQGKGIGTQMMSYFLHEVAESRPEILRVEIFVLESNPAYRLYKRLGFVEEGVFKDAKLHPNGHLESYCCMAWFNPNFQISAALVS